MQERVDRLCVWLAGLPAPVSAATLAMWLGIQGSRESRRRRVREAVDAARDAGHRVCANGSGYWLARSSDEWSAFQSSRRSRSVFAFVRDRRHREAVVDRGNEQRDLFENSKTAHDCAWRR